VRGARVSSTWRVVDRLSLPLKAAVPGGLGWNRIYSIRCWHINRTDNNTATHPPAEPLPIQFTRRDVPIREMTKIRIAMTRLVVDHSSETRVVSLVFATPRLHRINLTACKNERGGPREETTRHVSANMYRTRVCQTRVRNLLVINDSARVIVCTQRGACSMCVCLGRGQSLTCN